MIIFINTRQNSTLYRILKIILFLFYYSNNRHFLVPMKANFDVSFRRAIPLGCLTQRRFYNNQLTVLQFCMTSYNRLFFKMNMTNFTRKWRFCVRLTTYQTTLVWKLGMMILWLCKRTWFITAVFKYFYFIAWNLIHC